MRMPIFLKFVIVSLIIALLSLALSTLIFMFYQTLSPAYVFYVLIIIIGISFFAAGSFVEPLEKLKVGFESISKGEFKSVDIKTGDELEELAKSFNQMARELIEKKKRLESSEEMYRSLVENINDWVFEVDENFVFTYSSPKVTEIAEKLKEAAAQSGLLKHYCPAWCSCRFKGSKCSTRNSV